MPKPYNMNLCYDKKSCFSPIKIKSRDRTTFGVGTRGEIFVTNEILARPSPFNYKIKSKFTPRSYAYERLKSVSSDKSSTKSNSRVPDHTFGVPRASYDKVASFNGWSY